MTKLRAIPFILVLLLCLGGCGATIGAPQESTESTTQPTTTQAAAVPTTQPPLSAVDPDAEFTPFEPWVSSGKVVMPPLMGEEMLYPIYSYGGPHKEYWGFRMGLINAKGEVVASMIYETLHYITNAERTVVVGVLAGRLDARGYHWVHYDLKGNILAEPDYEGWMRPLPGGLYAEGSSISDDESREQGGLWSLKKNRFLIMPSYRQSISQIGADRFLLSIWKQNSETLEFSDVEHFVFDAKTGSRTSTPNGVVAVLDVEIYPCAPLIPARNSQGKYGYVNGELEWVVSPRFSFAYGFMGRDFTIAYDEENCYLVDISGKVIYSLEGGYWGGRDCVEVRSRITGKSTFLRVKDGICEPLAEPVPEQTIDEQPFFLADDWPPDEGNLRKFDLTGVTSERDAGLKAFIPAYPWVTQGLYAGYINENGDWLYRQSKYQGLED